MQRKQKRIISAKEAESFIQFRKYLEHQTDRSKALYNMATYLLSKDTLTDRQLSFKNSFFATFARELAGPCGCSEVVPDHLRINNPSKTQFLIELMLALYKKNLLGDISITQLARILVCSIHTDYTQDGMVNRLKKPLPEFEFVRDVVGSLNKKMKEVK